MRQSKTNKFKQGLFTPRFPEKYIGDVTKIRYMSGYEFNVHTYFDNNPNIIRWASEEIAIPYIHPVDGKVHNYYPDYYIEYRNTKGNLVREIIEVKPEKQVNQPTKRGKSKKTQLTEAITHAINTAKWEYAKSFCDKHNITFRILTETHIFGSSK